MLVSRNKGDEIDINYLMGCWAHREGDSCLRWSSQPLSSFWDWYLPSRELTAPAQLCDPSRGCLLCPLTSLDHRLTIS